MGKITVPMEWMARVLTLLAFLKGSCKAEMVELSELEEIKELGTEGFRFYGQRKEGMNVA